MNYQIINIYHKSKTEVILGKRNDGKYIVIEQPIINAKPFDKKTSIYLDLIKAQTHYNILSQENKQLSLLI